MAGSSGEQRKAGGRPFAPGVSGNPSGKKPIPPEIKEMRDAILSKAVKILYAKIFDAKYIAKLRPSELTHLLEVAYDRCGLPRVTQAEVTGKDGGSLVMTIRMGDKVPS